MNAFHFLFPNFSSGALSLNCMTMLPDAADSSIRERPPAVCWYPEFATPAPPAWPLATGPTLPLVELGAILCGCASAGLPSLCKTDSLFML
jgi:hypothetical protein